MTARRDWPRDEAESSSWQVCGGGEAEKRSKMKTGAGGCCLRGVDKVVRSWKKEEGRRGERRRGDWELRLGWER